MLPAAGRSTARAGKGGGGGRRRRGSREWTPPVTAADGSSDAGGGDGGGGGGQLPPVDGLSLEVAALEASALEASVLEAAALAAGVGKGGGGGRQRRRSREWTPPEVDEVEEAEETEVKSGGVQAAVKAPEKAQEIDEPDVLPDYLLSAGCAACAPHVHRMCSAWLRGTGCADTHFVSNRLRCK